MELLCNLQLVKKHDLTPTIYFFLVSLYAGEEYQWELPNNQLKILERNGWIKISPTGPVIRNKFAQTFKKYVASNDVDEWIQEFRNLWPSGVRSGGRLVRGDRRGCLKKMQKFVKDYPEYSKEEILDAARVYVFDRSLNDNTTVTCADYFIEKNNVSLLAAFLEDVETRERTMRQIRGGGENSPFHREV